MMVKFVSNRPTFNFKKSTGKRRLRIGSFFGFPSGCLDIYLVFYQSLTKSLLPGPVMIESETECFTNQFA